MSVGSVLSLCGVILASCLQTGMPGFVAVTLTVLTGLGCGTLTGALVSKGRASTVYRNAWDDEHRAGDCPDDYRRTAHYGRTDKYCSDWFRKAWNHTKRMAADGRLLCSRIFHIKPYKDGQIPPIPSAEMRKQQGFPAYGYHSLKASAFAVSGLCAAIAGNRDGREGSIPQEPIAGTGQELDAIAAVIIGGTSMAGGEGKITGTFIGSLIAGVVRNGMIQLGVGSYPQQVVIGSIIICVVMMDMLSRNRRKINRGGEKQW